MIKTSIFIIYLFVMLCIGLYFYIRTKNVHDFVLGGRKLGAFPSAISSVASDHSGWVLLGLPGFALTGGMGAFWIAVGLSLGFFASWSLLSNKLRTESENIDNTVTIPTFLEKKLKDPTGFLRLSLSIAILFFFVFYTSSGFVASGKLFTSMFNIDYKIAVIIGFLVVMSYTLLGGYLAVSWTDVIQGCLMVAGLLIVPLMAINNSGGISTVFEKIKEINPNHIALFRNPDGSTLTFISILSLMAWGLGYFGQPHILARYMGISSAKKTSVARTIAVIISVFLMGMAILVGLVGVAYFNENPLSDPEQVYLKLISAVSHPIIGGLLLASVMAAIMSTADSQLLVASSALTIDIFSKRIDAKRQLLYSRLTVLLIAIIAMILAINPNSSVLGIVSYAWAGLGASCGAVLTLTLLWKKTTYQGGIAGVIVGAIVTIVWNKLSGGIFDLYELLPAFLCAFLAVVIVSTITQKNSNQ